MDRRVARATVVATTFLLGCAPCPQSGWPADAGSAATDGGDRTDAVTTPTVACLSARVAGERRVLGVSDWSSGRSPSLTAPTRLARAPRRARDPWLCGSFATMATL